MDPHEKFASQTMSAASATIMMYAISIGSVKSTLPCYYDERILLYDMVLHM